MTKLLTEKQREKLDELVSSCVIWNLDVDQSLEYIKDKLGKPISERYFYEVRQKILLEHKKRFKRVQHTQEALYALDFLECREQVNNIKKDMFELYLKLKKDSHTNPKLLLNILIQLKDTTLDYMQLMSNIKKIPDTGVGEFRIAGIDEPRTDEERQQELELEQSNKLELTR